ncbi:hypothetical protein V6N13_021929 [Hibiscus sabdariffa]
MATTGRATETRSVTEVKSATTLFVHNLPEKLHWKELWAAFGHHGDVVDAFIPKKRSKNGRRSGFVRFSVKAYAICAITRLNGFILFGSRISVSYSRFKPRTTYWRKVNQSKLNKTQGAMEQHSAIRSKLTQNSVPASLPSKESYPQGNDRPKVTGFIAEEALWNLQYCLVGFTTNETDSNRVHERLCKWGLGEIKVKRMAGRIFLLEVDNYLTFNSLKESNWSYLKEIFVEVQPWAESFKIPERVTWIELIGTPLHCWNHHTFKKIAEIWGELLALGENAFQTFGAERMTLLISTNQLEMINSAFGSCRDAGLPSHIPTWAKIVGNCNSGRPQEQNRELGIGAGQLTSPPDPAQAENVDVAKEDMGPVRGVEQNWADSVDKANNIPTPQGEQDNHQYELSEEAKTLWGDVEVDFLFYPTEGRSGGIITLGDTKMFSVVSSVCKMRFIAVKGPGPMRIWKLIW